MKRTLSTAEKYKRRLGGGVKRGVEMSWVTWGTKKIQCRIGKEDMLLAKVNGKRK